MAQNGPKSKRPSNVAFKQQRLRAWQPILTPRLVLPCFFIVALVFLPIGIALLIASLSVKEVTVDYTRCMSVANANVSCADVVTVGSGAACQCLVPVTVDEDFDSQVYMYYELHNYYQNHRRYVKSRDDAQLRGHVSASSACSPLQFEGGVSIAPCGFIANSFFNDTIGLVQGTGTNQQVIALSGSDIAWKSDRDTQFQNPSPQNNLELAFQNSVHPPYWQFNTSQIPSGVEHPDIGQGYENQDFIVWMRTAALPTFRKLYRKVDTANGQLPAGEYTFAVNYTYPVVSFQGEKKLVLTTLSWIGAKNDFLGIAYLVVGSLSLAVGIVLLLFHLISPRQPGDPKYLIWEQ